MCDIEALVKRDECNSNVLYQTRGQKSMKGVSNFVGVGSDELVYSSLGLFYFLAPFLLSPPFFPPIFHASYLCGSRGLKIGAKTV